VTPAAPRPLAAEARRLLALLAARPRPAGGADEAAARAHCASALRAAGFRVREEAFAYSQAPGRLATPVAGTVSMLALAAAGHVGWRGSPEGALAVLAAAGLPLALGSAWLVRRGVLALPWMRAESVNLVAVRGEGEPSVWLMAHLDSKSQPVPIGARALGIALTALAWTAAIVVAVAQMAGAPVGGLWPWVSGVGVLAGVPVALSVVRARSRGALDDASGVATVLLAALAAPPSLPLGVALTSAEELGLAGARAWVAGRPAGTAVNVDGVDDAGQTRLMWTGRRPDRLLGTLLGSASRLGIGARASRLLPGILADGVALADAGWEVVTLSRGTARTVARIHTPADEPSRISGEGIAESALLIVEALRAAAETA
jgi:hypothetical protein